MKSLLFSAAVASCALVGCSMEPTYQRPAMPVPNSYPSSADTTSASAAAPVDAAEMDWHAFFKDPVLQRLIEIALTNNRDLRVVAAKMAEARADYGEKIGRASCRERV